MVDLSIAMLNYQRVVIYRGMVKWKTAKSHWFGTPLFQPLNTTSSNMEYANGIWTAYGIRHRNIDGTWDIMRSYHPLTSLTWRAAGNSHQEMEVQKAGKVIQMVDFPESHVWLISKDIKDGYANLTQTLRSLRWCFLFYVEPSVEEILFGDTPTFSGLTKTTTKDQMVWADNMGDYFKQTVQSCHVFGVNTSLSFFTCLSHLRA